MADSIRLSIPATSEYVRLARLTAASLASRLGFTFDEVEDLRIAVDELCHCLMGGGTHGATVDLVCTVLDRAVRIEGRLQTVNGATLTAGPGMTELSKRILDAVVDQYEIHPDVPVPSFSLLKQQTPTQ